MTRVREAASAALLALVFGSHAHAKPPAPPRTPAKPSKQAPKPTPHVEIRPAPPLPMLPSVGRVRVEVSRDHVVVLETVTLPRGDWQSGGLDLYVAFGSPGTPEAVDARLAATALEGTDPHNDDPGQPVAVEQAVQRLPNAQLLLGRPQMAGVVLHVKEADLRRALEGRDSADLRIRSLLSLPAADVQGARGVVVRLGISASTPLTLGRIQVVSLEGKGYVERAEAKLCGADAVGGPMTVGVVPKEDKAGEAPGAAAEDAPIAPINAVRHASDDLCVRWWTAL